MKVFNHCQLRGEPNKSAIVYKLRQFHQGQVI